MKTLHHKVNIVPIIAKADALTQEELVQMKQTVCVENTAESIRTLDIGLDSRANTRSSDPNLSNSRM